MFNVSLAVPPLGEEEQRAVFAQLGAFSSGDVDMAVAALADAQVIILLHAASILRITFQESCGTQLLTSPLSTPSTSNFQPISKPYRCRSSAC